MSRHDWAALSKVLAWKRRPFADLPTIQVRPVPLPEGHPDLDTFDADMAYLARLGRQAWSAALDGGHTDDTTASLYEEMIAELSIVALQLHLAIALATFDFILDDINTWKKAA